MVARKRNPPENALNSEFGNISSLCSMYGFDREYDKE